MNYEDRIYSGYRSAFKGETDETFLRWSAGKIRPILEPWLDGLDRDWPVVDLGCGAGEVLIALKELGFHDIGGCDLSAEQVTVARALFPQVEEVNLFNFLYERGDGTLGAVVIFDVVEHLGAQATFDLFDLIVRKLRVGGVLIVHLPNGLSPFVGHVYWGDMTHRWCLTPQSARTLCELVGFSEFAATEHRGISSTFAGRLRAAAWVVVRSLLQWINAIETGSKGGEVWTRNFAFRGVRRQ